MSRVAFATVGLAVLIVLLVALPTRAIVIESMVTKNPFVVVSSVEGMWSEESSENASLMPTRNANILPPELHALLVANSALASSYSAAVDIIPIHWPKPSPYVVFAIYLTGALVFYGLLVLVAQPSPNEFN